MKKKLKEMKEITIHLDRLVEFNHKFDESDREKVKFEAD